MMTVTFFYYTVTTEAGIIPRRALLELKKDVPAFYLDEKLEIINSEN